MSLSFCYFLFIFFSYRLFYLSLSSTLLSTFRSIRKNRTSPCHVVNDQIKFKTQCLAYLDVEFATVTRSSCWHWTIHSYNLSAYSGRSSDELTRDPKEQWVMWCAIWRQKETAGITTSTPTNQDVKNPMTDPPNESLAVSPISQIQDRATSTSRTGGMTPTTPIESICSERHQYFVKLTHTKKSWVQKMAACWSFLYALSFCHLSQLISSVIRAVHLFQLW